MRGHLQPIYPAHKLKPLLDSFQGSFKDNFRFFAGIYFFYRWVAVITYAIIPFTSLFYTVVQALLIGILVFHSVSQPYQKRWHNILDSLLFADLNLINGITILNYYWTRVDVGRESSLTTSRTAIMSSIQLVLIYLPLLYALLYACSCCLAKVFCRGEHKDAEKNEFVLKIRRKISLGSEDASSPEEALPYRLVQSSDAVDPFTESEVEGGSAIIDYH